MTQWSNGGPLALAATLGGRAVSVQADAKQLLQDIAAEANVDQRHLIEKAETKTGRERAGKGAGVAGRVDTGLMINSTKGVATEGEDGSFEAAWGWADPEAYFAMQDWGTQRIAPALSLYTSYLVARTKFRAGMRGLLTEAGFH